MLSKLLTILSLSIAFNTPYPYMLSLGIVMIIFVWCGVFLTIKNGFVGYLLLTVTLGALITGLIELNQNWNGSEDAHLDNKMVHIVSINRYGFLLNTGERVIPAGITMPKLRHLRELTDRVMSLVEDTRVRLIWDDEMNGYRMLADDKDISEFLVINGLAKPNEDASLEMHELAETAKKNRLGVWSRPLLKQPSTPLFIAAAYYCYNLLKWVFFVAILLVWHGCALRS